jgi:hypothetical protein
MVALFSTKGATMTWKNIATYINEKNIYNEYGCTFLDKRCNYDLAKYWNLYK